MRKRKITPEIKAVFRDFKAQANKYGHGDPFNEIQTIEMKDLPHELLPKVDRFGELSVQMVKVTR